MWWRIVRWNATDLLIDETNVCQYEMTEVQASPPTPSVMHG